MKKNIKPKIYKYNDIVVFLNDVFIFFKNKDHKSLRDYAKELKMATGMLPMILNRKRIPTEELLKKIMKKFEYHKNEIDFAKNLRLVGYSEKYTERKQAIYKINKNKKYRDLNKNEYELYKYLSKWYFVAIKEMVELSDFKEDANWIRERLAYKVGLKEVELALVFLKKNNILIYENDKLKPTQKNINCEEGIFKLTLGGFHKQIFELAAEAIDSVPREKRKILGHTLKVGKNNLEQINSILTEAHDKIKNLNSNSTDDEDVYHIELISIPITKKTRKL